ncbi:CotY/CotZ family spore coat protein [Anoxybacteroides rupiense]|uniref:CotY/CotZ family spore coat protein n=1 Tax=Anoxybacteroides rupiense TaxID=311460 RepID=UPI003FA5BC93
MGHDKHHKDYNCVCRAVEEIFDAQEAIEEQCPTSCFSNLLNPAISPGRDTVPFILYTKKGDPFTIFGNVGGFTGDMACFKTIFFRVENIKDCCATLSLLRPVDGDGETISVCDPCDPDFFGLEKTNYCIEVDLQNFTAIQCLPPDLVGRARDTKKHHYHG